MMSGDEVLDVLDVDDTDGSETTGKVAASHGSPSMTRSLNSISPLMVLLRHGV